MLIHYKIFIFFIFRYIKLKFDQINTHLQNLSKDVKYEIKPASQNPIIQVHQRRFSKNLSNQYIIWTVM